MTHGVPWLRFPIVCPVFIPPPPPPSDLDGLLLAEEPPEEEGRLSFDHTSNSMFLIDLKNLKKFVGKHAFTS